MRLQLDDWQNEVLNAKGDIVVCAGRQTGKSAVVAIKTAEFMINNPKKLVLVISTTEDQSQLMITKIYNYLYDNYKNYIKKGKTHVTKHLIDLKNGSTVRCKAVGTGGTSIRGFTIDLLIVDEASRMPEDVWAAATPAVWGDTILISTPFGRTGYFFECYEDKDFKTFHVNSLEVMNNRPLSSSWTQKQRDKKLRNIEKDKNKMSELEFRQEYMGEFVDDLAQFFEDKLIRKCMTLQKPESIPKNKDYYLGVDIARMGKDESTFEVLRMTEDTLFHVDNQITKKTRLTETAGHIIGMNNIYDFRKIYIDDEGIGVGVLDMLIENFSTRRKTKALRNSKKVTDFKDDTKTRMLKVDLYMNMRRLMEQGKINLLDDEKVFQSYKSVQYEYTVDKKGKPFLKIFGNYTHIVEGLNRAAWSIRDKYKKFFITYM